MYNKTVTLNYLKITHITTKYKANIIKYNTQIMNHRFAYLLNLRTVCHAHIRLFTLA